MAVKSIGIVSFNTNEAHAVDLLLNDIASGPPSPWQRDGAQAIQRPFTPGDVWRLEHVPLLAQGNVIAAARLAEYFQDHSQAPDYVVFFGCAGAVDPSEHASVFLVHTVNYLSLGSVDAGSGGSELVTLKNKWICHLSPSADSSPLESLSFPLAEPGNSTLDLSGLTGVTPARVVATDKVVRVAPTGPPAKVQHGPPHDLYAKADWSYGQALGLFSHSPHVIVEMESYGIALIAQALKIEKRVVVLRVATDILVDHATGKALQAQLLDRGRFVLARVLAALFNPWGSP